MIRIELETRAVEAGLNRLFAAASDLSKPMNDIGMALVASTEGRFAAEVSPEGTPWAARSPVTIERYLAEGASFGGILHKTGQLGGEISHDYGPDHVEVGSGRVYAAMVQMGGTKAAFPHLWGDIPARPYIGLSDEDGIAILEIIDEFFEAAAAEG